MSYHKSSFLIVYIIRLTTFDSFKVKWLNSHIFYESYGYKDIDMQVGRCGYDVDEKEEETTLHQI